MATSFIDGGILGSWRKPQVTGKLYNIKPQVTGKLYSIKPQVTGKLYHIKPQVTGKLYHIKLYQVYFHHRAEITMTEAHNWY